MHNSANGTGNGQQRGGANPSALYSFAPAYETTSPSPPQTTDATPPTLSIEPATASTSNRLVAATIELQPATQTTPYRDQPPSRTQQLYSFLPSSPASLSPVQDGQSSMQPVVKDSDGGSTVGASAAKRYFHLSPLRDTGRDKVAKGLDRSLPTPAYFGSLEDANDGVPTTKLHTAPAAPTDTHQAPQQLSEAPASEAGAGNGNEEHNGGETLVAEPPHLSGGSDDGIEDGLSDRRYVPPVQLTPEEEQAARLQSYREMVGGGASATAEAAAADSTAGESDAPAGDAVEAAPERGFVSDTVHTILPDAVTNFLSRSVHTVAQTTSNVVPDKVKSAAHTAGHTISVGAQHIGDAIEKLPNLMVSAIPSAVMSDDVKQLLFTDFSNTFRSFFHTNILSMPFVFRQAGLVGGIVLLAFVAVTSEYATEAYFGAKNQMKNAHKVVLYGDVPRMVWGDWYPTINLFYGITHLIGFIAFSSSNAVVLLGAMGMTGGGARALGLIIPSLIALPLVFMKNAHSQQPLAIMSNTLVLTSVIIMCIDFPYTPQPPIKLWASTFSDFFVALGVTVYAFTGIGSTIPVERVMTPQRYRKLLRISVAISWCLLMAFGLSGFLSYGNHTCSVMTVSLQAGPLRTTASALLFFASLMIIPQQTFPLCELSDRRVLGIMRLTHYWDLQPNLLRISYLIISAFAAFIVPYYGLVLSISGSLGCGIVGLVVPSALDYVRRERWALRHGRTLRWWEYFIVFGLGFYGCIVVVIGVVSGSYTLWKAIQTYSSDAC